MKRRENNKRKTKRELHHVHVVRVNQTSASDCLSFGGNADNDESKYSFYDVIRECLGYITCAANTTSSCLRASQHRLKGGSNVIQVEKENPLTKEVALIRLMHLAVMIPIGIFEGAEIALPFSNAIAKAALMAAYHFNNRLDTVVPELADQRLQNCDVKMTLDFFDTKLSPIEAARVLDRHVHMKEFPYQTTAVVGGASSSVSSQLAILNSIRHIPQISYASSSTELDNKDRFPLFGRVVSSNDGNAIAGVEYLVNSLSVTHFGILYVRNSYGTAYRRALQAEAANRKLTTVAYSVPPSLTGEGMGDAMRLLKESGLRYFVAIIFDSALVSFLNEASTAGIIGPGYFWMLGENADSSALTLLTLSHGSPLVEAAHGLAFLSRSVDFSSTSFSGFLKEWDRFDDDLLFRDYFASKSPLASDIPFSATYTPYISEVFASEIYDSVMSLGLSACEATQRFFNGPELFESFRNLMFQGATGFCEIDPITGSRKHETSTFIIKNVLPNEPNANGDVRFKATQVMEYKLRNCPDNGTMFFNDWQSISDKSFNYSGGTSTPPMQLPSVVLNTNNVEPWLLILGLTLGIIVMGAAASFGFWTWCHRKSSVVQRSQPLFLGILCIGVFLMATSTFSLSARAPPLPEEYMNFFCMYGYWVFAIGFAVTLSALLSKLRRVNMIVKNQSVFRRVVVNPKDVMLPGVVVVSCNVLVLTVWQILAPLQYKREYKTTTFDRFGRPTDSVGACDTQEGDLSNVVFLAPLLFINFVALIFANVEAYKARNINTEYSESLYVGYTMAALLQCFAIACPLLLIQGTAAKAKFLFRTIFVIASSTTVLCFIFIPKVSYYYYDLREQNKIDTLELEVIDEEDDEQSRGIRILSVSSAVETENTPQPSAVRDGFMRIVRRPIKPRSRRPSRNVPRSGRDALYSREVAENADKKAGHKRVVYNNTTPTPELTYFAMTAM